VSAAVGEERVGPHLSLWYTHCGANALSMLPISSPILFLQTQDPPGGNLIPTYPYLVSELRKRHAATSGIYTLSSCVFRERVTASTVFLG